MCVFFRTYLDYKIMNFRHVFQKPQRFSTKFDLEMKNWRYVVQTVVKKCICFLKIGAGTCLSSYSGFSFVSAVSPACIVELMFNL